MHDQIRDSIFSFFSLPRFVFFHPISISTFFRRHLLLCSVGQLKITRQSGERKQRKKRKFETKRKKKRKKRRIDFRLRVMRACVDFAKQIQFQLKIEFSVFFSFGFRFLFDFEFGFFGVRVFLCKWRVVRACNCCFEVLTVCNWWCVGCAVTVWTNDDDYHNDSDEVVGKQKTKREAVSFPFSLFFGMRYDDYTENAFTTYSEILSNHTKKNYYRDYDVSSSFVSNFVMFDEHKKA